MRHEPDAADREPVGLVDRALIVDPDPDTRLLYRTALGPLTRTIIEAEDGAEALGKAIGQQPTLIVTATTLPRMDGLALCTLLRTDPATAQARIVIVTSAASAAVADRAAAAGADAVLVKPCAIDHLVTTVRRVCAEAPRADDDGGETSGEEAAHRRTTKSRAYDRRLTTSPPKRAPEAFCPTCARPLIYLHSYTGGVSDRYPEQWDYLACSSCGMFRYRHRTRRLTRVVAVRDGSQRGKLCGIL